MPPSSGGVLPRLRRSLVVALAVALASVAATGCGTTIPAGGSPGSASDTGPGAGGGGGASELTAGGDASTGARGPQASSGGVASAAAFAAGSSGGPGSTTLPGSAGGRTAKAISVGFLVLDVAKLVATVGASASSDPQATNRALVKALNARGGLAGRSIEPVYYTIDGSSTDTSSQEQAACAAFTQDHHVEAVVGGGGNAILYACLLHAGVPIVDAASTEAMDEMEWRKYPNLFAPDALALDRVASSLIEQGVRAGSLSSRNKLGVITRDCSWGTRAFRNVLLPAAQRHGITVVSHSIGCPNDGAGAVSSDGNEMQSAVLQFRAAGVDRVTFLTANDDPACYFLFIKYADSQNWAPRYVVASTAGVTYWWSQGLLSNDQVARTQIVGISPFLDVSKPAAPAAFRSCVALIVAGGGSPPPDTSLSSAGDAWACDAVLLLRAGLIHSGGVGGLAALRPAIERLDTSFASAGNIDGASNVAADRHDGVRLVAVSSYDAQCGCLRYITNAQPAA